MSKSFNEYFNENFEDGLSSPSKYILQHTFEAGQQSKQAEIDELREMVRRLVDNTIVAVDDALENKANDLIKGDQS